ncbi:hypothetical protein NXC24_CH01527 [Rhizobium sp. NXC24]|nr:hypothetical protein NXC24_CH01527 [Rhizobium sp. NXC24]
MSLLSRQIEIQPRGSHVDFASLSKSNGGASKKTGNLLDDVLDLQSAVGAIVYGVEQVMGAANAMNSVLDVSRNDIDGSIKNGVDGGVSDVAGGFTSNGVGVIDFFYRLTEQRKEVRPEVGDVCSQFVNQHLRHFGILVANQRYIIYIT